MSALVLGIIDIAIVAVVLIVVGLLVVWFAKLMGFGDVPENLRKVYLVLVFLIVLYMIVALLFGMPTLRPISGMGSTPRIMR